MALPLPENSSPALQELVRVLAEVNELPATQYEKLQARREELSNAQELETWDSLQEALIQLWVPDNDEE